MALFSDTVSLFHKGLDEDRFARVPADIQKWYAQEPEGWFGLGPSEQKIKLEELARYLYELISIFEKDDDLRDTEPYQLFHRLFCEQCEFTMAPTSRSTLDHFKKGNYFSGIRCKGGSQFQNVISARDGYNLEHNRH